MGRHFPELCHSRPLTLGLRLRGLRPPRGGRLTSEPERYAAFTREYLGWDVFTLMTREVPRSG